MLKKFLVVLVCAPVVYFAAWIGFLTVSLENAPEVSVVVKGYDPRDLLSGHFLNLAPDWAQTDCAQFENGICPEEAFENNYRYYVPEEAAPKLEKMIFEPQTRAELVFAFLPKMPPRVKNLLINGKVWQEALN